MEGRLGFLTKARRELPNYNDTVIGPGEYTHQPALNARPNFAPFCTTSKRDLPGPQAATPSPGDYEVSASYSKSNGVAAGTIFKSKTKRFIPEKQSVGPAPGTYVLQPAIQVKKSMRRSRSQPAHLDSLRQLATHGSAPSIPTKYQSFGYEETETGDLRLQEPLKPGFTGVKNDTVGPGDYDPKPNDSRHHRAPTSLFHKGAPRQVGEKASTAPGPGYYNFKSSFEPLDDGGAASDGNFYLRLNQASKRQLSSFESTTQRPGLMGRKVDPNEPGPGSYNIPRNGVEVKKKDPKPIPRSQQVKTHAGSYNPVTSDFEKNRIDILRRKRMLARSGWAQNISFGGTEERFHENGPVSGAPPPGTYTPKTALVDYLPKENPRGGAFGSTIKRFYSPPSAMTQSPTRDSEDIDHGFSAYHNHAAAANAAAGNGNENGRHPSPPFSKPVKPSRPFANNEDRFTGKKDVTNAPPPGTYDKPLSWKAAGVLKIKDHTNKSLVRTKRDTPGPGDYSVGRDLLHKGRANPHFVMGGSNERFQGRAKDVMPGPGQYDPTPLLGSLIKPTYNAIMVDEISAHR